MKKDTLELRKKVLRHYLGASKGGEERDKIIEEFSISSSLKMIKTTFLEKRIQAVKTLVDVIKFSKTDKEKRSENLKLIEDNQVFRKIYGPNLHIKLINKKKELFRNNAI